MQFGASYFDGASVRPVVRVGCSRRKRGLADERKVLQKVHRLVGNDEFTTDGAINMLKDTGYRNIPTSVGLGQMMRISPYFTKVRVEYSLNGSRKYKVTVWRRIA